MKTLVNRYAHIHHASRSHRGADMVTDYQLHQLHTRWIGAGCGCAVLHIGREISDSFSYRLGRRSVRSEGGTLETTVVGGRFAASLCGARGVMGMIICIIGTESERGSGRLPAWAAGAARRDGGAVRWGAGRCEPPSENRSGTAGGPLSTRMQLRLTIALEKTPVHLSESHPEAA